MPFVGTCPDALKRYRRYAARARACSHSSQYDASSPAFVNESSDSDSLTDTSGPDLFESLNIRIQKFELRLAPVVGSLISRRSCARKFTRAHNFKNHRSRFLFCKL